MIVMPACLPERNVWYWIYAKRVSSDGAKLDTKVCGMNGEILGYRDDNNNNESNGYRE